MIAESANRFDPWQRERLLLVAPYAIDDSIGQSITGRYPNFRVSTCDTYLSAVADLVRSPARTIVACVDPRLKQMENAVSGLRRAAGSDTRIVLVCVPETESTARELLDRGADEYVLHPLKPAELDAAIQQNPSNDLLAPSNRTPSSPWGDGRGEGFLQGANDHAPESILPGTLDELAQLGEVLEHLNDPPKEFLARIAMLIRTAMNARSATIAVQGSAATDGEQGLRAVLAAALPGVGGSIAVGERAGAAYSIGDAEKLEHYARVVGPILQTASRQRMWQRLAMTDECSGLPNRRYLNERLNEILKQAAAHRYPVTMLLFDIDDFKSYNDAHGHTTGDNIIRGIGEMFRRHCREHDVVTRYGGDEFAVVFWDPHGPRVPGSKHPDCALNVLQRIREALQTEKIEGLGTSGTGCLTISGGLATFPWDASDAKSLIHRADEALMAAKRAGKNRVLLIGEQV